MKKQINVRIAKTDESERTATGLVYAPMTLDSQNDFMTAPDIKAASQRFMKSGKTRAIDVNHSGVAVDAFVAESMISKGGDFPAGSWVVTTKIDDDAVWKAVRDGTLTGFSLMGTGSRHVAKINGKSARQLTDLNVQAISLVGKAANMEKFSVIKSEDPMQELARQLTAIADSIQKTNVAIQKHQREMDEQLASLTTAADGRVVRKVATSNLNPYADEIDAERRMHTRLEDRLWSIMERPDQFPDDAEAELRSQIVKSEDRLFSLGYNPQRTELDSNCAFFERGGTSTFLQGGISNLDDILGISRHTRALEKSADEIDLYKIYI